MYTILVLFFLAVVPSICKGQHDNTCDVLPKDQYIEMGSSIKIVCQTSCVNSNVFWTLNSRPIDGSLSSTINNTQTVLSLSNFTHYSAVLQCHSAVTHQILGGTTIRTYSKPRRISCILDYINQEVDGVPEVLRCSWEHQADPSLTINYTVYASILHPSRIEICNSHETTCVSKHVHILRNFSVMVRAKTSDWEADSDSYEFKPSHILKIIRPKLAVTAFSDHLLVEWNRSLDWEKCHCQVKYNKDLPTDEGSQEWVLNKTLNPKEKGKISIEKVDSCVNYKISVRCALDQAPWSFWSKEKKVLTKLNKSHVSLHLWRKVTELDQSRVRRVHVMWKDFPSTCQGTFKYIIKQMPHKEDMNSVNDSSCGNSTCDVDVDQDAQRLILTVFHDEILLAEDSVYVPAVGESLPQVTGIQTSTYEGVILVSWKAPIQPVSGYMVDWTHSGNQIYWKETNYTNTTLSDLLDKKPYNITVTPLLGDRTGHSTQALHICSSVGDPGKVDIISVKAYDKSAYVSWGIKSPEECSGVVINYTVFYESSITLLNVTVDSKKQGVILKDLNPETQYRVYVEARALTGITSSTERVFTTKKFDPRLITTLSVCGSIVIFLVLSLGLCCTVQWKKFKEKPVPNPGLSTVALWLSPSHQKGRRPFYDPSASPCDPVYTEETLRASTPSPDADCSGNPTTDETEEYTDSVIILAPHTKGEIPVEPLSSPEESTALFSSESNRFNPYRSQTSVEVSSPRSSKQSKPIPVKQQGKATLKTIYVTLDMFEQGQSR
ncbi:interleukin-31 receptor subunit alpha-like [Acanthochromis polyacanthus]|uniref:Interleukin-31 receptor subunit alpha-like n=1 Tax=Acanthochromis polyacanthus TaxID=80966 RepID=A0A3Q1HA71_9TELE|nr:interleukin-31 receptor subunit alpha-like [Acanthochromis polyacanthus]